MPTMATVLNTLQIDLPLVIILNFYLISMMQSYNKNHPMSRAIGRLTQIQEIPR